MQPYLYPNTVKFKVHVHLISHRQEPTHICNVLEGSKNLAVFVA